MQFPEVPEVPAEQRDSGPLYLRYEDISQDGRVLLSALPQAIGMIVWRKLISQHPISLEMRDQGGIVPILTRFVVEGGGGPVAVMHPLEGDGRFELGHTRDEAGEVDHLLLNMFVEINGEIGHTAGPPPPNQGEPVFVGRIYAEHVFTRLFAPPDQRKVLRFAMKGYPPVPPKQCVWTPQQAALDLPAGAVSLDDDLSADDSAVVFGLAHTDSNQHVNSLVYPRLFEEAALRRLAAHGKPTRLLARMCDVAYRKPCFAGDRMRILLRAFEHEGSLGAVGVFVPEDDRGARPHCYLQMSF